MRRWALLLTVCFLGACSDMPPQGDTPYTPSAAMQKVLAERQAMHAKLPEHIDVDEARDVPNLIYAEQAIPNVAGQPAPIIDIQQFSQFPSNGVTGDLTARLYRPRLANNTPAIIYFPGGTWASGTLDMYDQTARELCARTGYVVVMIRTRLAPDAPFPGEHDDAMAGYQWARAHLREWGGDPTRVALAGEGPGANLALSTALAARDRAAQGSPVPTPDYLLLVTPVAGTELNTPSMSENGNSRPLTRGTVRWAQRLYAPDNLDDPRIDLVRRSDFAGMPPTTVILADIDPLRSGGQELAERMSAAGVPVEARLFHGVTYDFFGLGIGVPEAAEAETYAANRLRVAFNRQDLPPLARPIPPARRAPRRSSSRSGS